MSVNINFIGRLGADAEVKESAKGKFVVYRVATDVWDSQAKANKTEWFRVSDFSPRTLSIAEHLKKGRQVYVSGAEYVSQFVDKEGKTQVSRDVNAYVTDFVNSGNSGQTATQTTVVATPTQTNIVETPVHSMPVGMGVIPPVAPAGATKTVFEDEDLPF